MSSHLVLELERLTGHEFRDHALALEALTHTSYAHEHPGAPHYERLEFLGDSVVNLAATVMLTRAYPDEAEGTLTRRRQEIVSTLALGEVGLRIGLHRLIRLGAGERQKDNVEPKVVGSAVEAVLGALMQDAGFEVCLRTCARWLNEAVNHPRPAVQQAAFKDPKSALQEHTQARWKSTPEYVELGMKGPAHEPQWHFEVRVQGEALADGFGKRKDDAMKAAANLALAELLRREADLSRREAGA